MSGSLVIVESPAKARTISRFLDSNYKVVACMGHVKDLPDRTLGIDVNNNFKPRYVLTNNGRKVVNRLCRDAAVSSDVYLATDPDREGEAIAWHLEEELAPHTKAEFHRVAFHEITVSAVKKAFAEAKRIDRQKVAAQQARRILDRLVGYKISPLLWKHVARGTSAGRVQSVALRLVCERERAINEFVSREYWNLTAHFSPLEKEVTFPAQLMELDSKKPNIPDAETANALAAEIESARNFTVSDRKTSRKQKRPAPPFITSTLQQVAGSRIRLSTRQTMVAAQQLYEGVEFGKSGPTGLITYMRTDSFAVSDEARQKARSYIVEAYGENYVPSKPNRYRTRQNAQEAHEAIRPTDPRRTPEEIAAYLSPVQLKLYRLIWQRFIASQMAPAQLRQNSIEIKPENSNLKHDYLFRSTVTETIFPGFTKVFEDCDIDTDPEAEKKKQQIKLPDLSKGDSCELRQLDREQSFTQPPNRFSEATLVRELERNGVGRPSTYATIVNTIQERKYAEKNKGRLVPTQLGFKVNDYLISNMERLFQVKFTAEMENQLDKVEQGQEDMVHMLEQFYKNFVDSVTDAEVLDPPVEEKVKKVLDLFPDNMQWREPVKYGKRSYDDKKFFLSLRDQVETKKKPLSDKQWRALLALAARYADQLPELKKVAGELEITTEMQQLIEGNRQQEKEKKGESSEDDPMVDSLFDSLNRVEWEEPKKRGKVKYDDRKFFQSLKKHKESGRNLSPAQRKALVRLARRYQEQIADFSDLNKRYDLTSQENGQSGESTMSQEEKEKTERLISLLDHITEWKEPRQVRGRTFDDREFTESIKRQWREKATLTSRQISALRRLISHYRDQIPYYNEIAEELSLSTAAKGGNRKKERKTKESTG